MLYSAFENGPNEDVYRLRVGGQNPINLTADSQAHDSEPAFSPDGEQIAFVSTRMGGGIFVMGATGENPTSVCVIPGSPRRGRPMEIRSCILLRM